MASSIALVGRVTVSLLKSIIAKIVLKQPQFTGNGVRALAGSRGVVFLKGRKKMSTSGTEYTL
jgi:hypothetical protein